MDATDSSGYIDPMNGDVFDVFIDGSYVSYMFKDPTNPPAFSLNPLSLSVALISPSDYDGPTVANIITDNFNSYGMRADYQYVVDPTSAFGYKQVLILRTVYPHNEIVLGDGSAVSKLGFVPGTTVYGNNDNTHALPELLCLNNEISALIDESNYLNILINLSDGTSLIESVVGTNFQNAFNIQNDCSTEIFYINGELSALETEISSLGNLITESNISTLSSNQSAYGDATTFDMTTISYNDSFYCPQNVDTSIGDTENSAIRWILDLKNGSQSITNILGDQTLVLTAPLVEQQFLNTNITGLNPPNCYVISQYQDNLQTINNGTWTGWGPYNYSLTNQIEFAITNSTDPRMVLDTTAISSFSYSNDTSAFTIFWNSNSLSLSYTEYTTVGSIVSAINNIAGLSAYNDTGNDSIPSTDIISGSGSLSLNTPVSLDKIINNVLNINTYNTGISYMVDTTSFTIFNGNTPTIYLFSSYPTLGALETALIGSSIFTLDLGYSYLNSNVLYPVSKTSMTPNTTVQLFDTSYTLFNLEYIEFNHQYYIDIYGLHLTWGGDSTILLSYSNPLFYTIGDMTSYINTNVPGLISTSNYSYENACFQPVSISEVSNSQLFAGLRDCTITYETIDMDNLNGRLNEVTARIATTQNRQTFLNTVRESGIIQNILSEESFVSQNGSTGNLYDWINNKFNRSTGSDAKLAQIQAQISRMQNDTKVNQKLLYDT